MNRIPYEKGALFLRTLERAFGRDRFDVFLRSYFDRFAFRSITTADFTAYLKDHLLLDPNESKAIDLAAWLEGPGLPTGFAEPKSARLDGDRPDGPRLARRHDPDRPDRREGLVDPGVDPLPPGDAREAAARAAGRARQAVRPDRAGQRRDRASVAADRDPERLRSGRRTARRRT